MPTTLIDPKTGYTTIFKDPTIHMVGRHGNHGFHLKGYHDAFGHLVEFREPAFVMVHDNTQLGLGHEELLKFAEESTRKTIWWSDGRCCYWFYDFRLFGHFCELISPSDDDEPIWECMHVNVYD